MTKFNNASQIFKKGNRERNFLSLRGETKFRRSNPNSLLSGKFKPPTPNPHPRLPPHLNPPPQGGRKNNNFANINLGEGVKQKPDLHSQPFDHSTFRPFNPSAFKPLSRSTVRPSNLSTYQFIIRLTYCPFIYQVLQSFYGQS